MKRAFSFDYVVSAVQTDLKEAGETDLAAWLAVPRNKNWALHFAKKALRERYPPDPPAVAARPVAPPAGQSRGPQLTYAAAMDALFGAFGAAGWEQSSPQLAVRHVTQGSRRIYFKPQSLYYEVGGPPWRLGDARSLPLSDLRELATRGYAVDVIQAVFDRMVRPGQ
jgi:hypothetical protein